MNPNDAHEVQTSEREALRRAFEQHNLRLVRLATLLAGSQSVGEDLVQDVYVRAAPRIGELTEPAVLPYLQRAVVNTWKNHVRHRRVEERSPGLASPAESRSEEGLELWTQVVQLPLRQRACIVLRYYEDFDDHEIAGLLGCRVGTVRSQVSRALAKLRTTVP